MKNKKANSRGWGVLEVPDKDPPSYKFMELHLPMTERFGGHHYLTGSYNGHFYGNHQVAICPTMEEQKRRMGSSYVTDHEIPAPSGVCSCGIYSQFLDGLRNDQQFAANSLCKLDLLGNVRYTNAGFRSSHANVMKIWTGQKLDNDQHAKAQRDLGVQIERIPLQHVSNGGTVHWQKFIDSDPELVSEMQKHIVLRNKWDRDLAGPCPTCGNEDTNLGPVIPKGGLDGRNGICNKCNSEWDPIKRSEES
jgi:hypothetical protein